MKIIIETIPHTEQRYPTAGDWQDSNEEILVKVSQLSDPRYEALIGIHEVVEAVLCHFAGISGQEVDKFDMDYELTRLPGERREPGDSPHSPYHHQHRIATIVETLVAHALGVNWNRYTAEVESL